MGGCGVRGAGAVGAVVRCGDGRAAAGQLPGSGGAGGAGGAVDQGSGAALVASSPAALAVVEEIQERFRVAAPSPPAMALPSASLPSASLPAASPAPEDGLVPPNAPGSDGEPAPALRAAQAQGFELEDGWLRPRFAAAAVADVSRRARVALSVRASDAFSVTDETSGVSVAVTLQDARPAPAEVAEGYVVYRGGHASGADLVHRVTAEGTEDFMLFEDAPAETAVAYRIALGDDVAGLRLIENTLELLDADGAPRLRMAPPYLVDADGVHHTAQVAVAGCAVDTEPAAPWDRPVTPPQTRACVVHVPWSAVHVAYPALLDPTWQTTGSLTTARRHHTASVLADGRVLVAGGYNSSLIPRYLSSAELYDPSSGTWSVTGGLTTARYVHSASVLADGRVLVAGGYNGGPLSSAELYDPTSGIWSATGSLTMARRQHTASVLSNGGVLLVGGFNNYVGGYLSNAELYDPSSGAWSVTGSLATGRNYHSASVLADGRVLVAGGYGVVGGLSSAELYDPASDTWSVTGGLTTGHSVHTASVLPDGRVLVAGGYNGGYLSSAELYDPSSGTWSVTASLTTARYFHTASVLANGRVLVAGGYNGGYLSSAELFVSEADDGVACTLASQCTSGQCVDGVWTGCVATPRAAGG